MKLTAILCQMRRGHTPKGATANELNNARLLLAAGIDERPTSLPHRFKLSAALVACRYGFAFNDLQAAFPPPAKITSSAIHHYAKERGVVLKRGRPKKSAEN